MPFAAARPFTIVGRAANRPMTTLVSTRTSPGIYIDLPTGLVDRLFHFHAIGGWNAPGHFQQTFRLGPWQKSILSNGHNHYPRSFRQVKLTMHHDHAVRNMSFVLHNSLVSPRSSIIVDAMSREDTRTQKVALPELRSWDRLGGTETMRRVVELFVDRAVADPRINYDRRGEYPQSEETIARTKTLALAFLSSALGGPISYQGRSLTEVHQPMAIEASELDAFM